MKTWYDGYKEVGYKARLGKLFTERSDHPVEYTSDQDVVVTQDKIFTYSGRLWKERDKSALVAIVLDSPHKRIVFKEGDRTESVRVVCTTERLIPNLGEDFMTTSRGTVVNIKNVESLILEVGEGGRGKDNIRKLYFEIKEQDLVGTKLTPVLLPQTKWNETMRLIMETSIPILCKEGSRYTDYITKAPSSNKP